jgi:UDP-3-O-[3-hydroxymyristoyl] N-acetylglucosamine deacetylase
MNVGVLDALFADRANYTIIEAPGARRETARPEFGVGLSLAAFASDL